MPAHDVEYHAKAAGPPSGHVFPAEQFDDAENSSPSPAPEHHQRAVAFADHYEHGDIEEEDENDEVIPELLSH